jgi:hypothetical protein
MKTLRSLLLLFAAVLCATGNAAPLALSEMARQAEDLRLADDPAWLALGHYRRTLAGKLESDADDPAFFLSLSGALDPHAELAANLRAFFFPQAADHLASCRFPARRHWLEARLNLPHSALACPEFDDWRAELKAAGVSLIFPAAYLNSPSSMYGHTFLRLDRAGQNDDNVLLSYTVNYTAQSNEADNELMYAYRGLFGGYPGLISVQPYYEKIKEYRDWENRDIWEYRLNLSADEVEQLLRHVWEVKPIHFDYYFMTENCSYRLMSLLDVARPGLNLRERFRLRAIPVDTVRAVVETGLVASIQYRPSAATLLSSHRSQLAAPSRALVQELADQDLQPDAPHIQTLAERNKAGVLETAYDLLRYRVLHDRLPREANAKPSYALLKARSAVKAPSPFTPPPTPSIRDDQGHKSSRVGAGLGYLGGLGYGELNLRSNYHDLTDPAPGFSQGAQIKFLDGSLRYYEDQRFRMEQFVLVGVRSLSPRDDFLKPLSWGVEGGAHRRWMHGQRPLLGYLNGEVGWSRALLGGLAYSTLAATFDTGEALKSGVDLAFGPRLGWLYQGLGGQGLAAFALDCYLIAHQYCGGRVEYTHAINLGSDLALKLNLAREKGLDGYFNQIGLNLYRYF